MSSNQNPEEEIELSKLLGVIGKGINNFFRKIGLLFKSIFHYLIVIIIFLKKYSLFLILSLIIGGTIGYFTQKYKGISYYYDMEIIPNYKSENYISSQIDYLQILFKTKSYPELSSILNISEEDLKNIKSINLIPLNYIKDKALAYEEFIKKNDTLVSSIVTFEKFNSKNFAKFNTTRFKVEIVVANPTLKKIQQPLIDFITNDPNLVLAHDLKIKNLNLEEKTIKQGLKDIDSLRKTNRIVALKSAENVTSLGSAIDINNSNDLRETETEIRNLTEDKNLFETSEKLIFRLNQIAEEKIRFNNIVNVVSHLNYKGVYNKTLTTNPIKLYGFGAFLVTLITILLIKFNIYLKNYKK
ncbi:hypothetical protein [Aureivirga marina]|uniref:hypothetical protein n=1 Tax=Aureivirga marina TaxID=1182451 RepID=UPI0018CA977F|nr:hypothetical protein [Aureivirga marina]